MEAALCNKIIPLRQLVSMPFFIKACSHEDFIKINVHLYFLQITEDEALNYGDSYTSV